MKNNFIYRIYYKFGIAYVGRTRQMLENRLRGHFFNKPMHRKLDLECVTFIEYAETKTQADMFLYEIYYINKDKPPLNGVDKSSKENLTVELPPLEFKLYDSKLLNKWKQKLGIEQEAV